MIGKLTASLRKNTWLLVAAFLGLAGSAWIGSLTHDLTARPEILWVIVVWSMLVLGAVIVVAVVIEAIMEMMGG